MGDSLQTGILCILIGMSERYERLERSLERLLSELIPTLKDPRIPIVVTVEKVRLSGDLSGAKVLVSSLEGEDQEAMVTALNGASGYLQRELAQELQARRTPRLHFTTHPGDVL